jgi:hypothetical protein
MVLFLFYIYVVFSILSQEHGLFEILQGNVRPDGSIREAIGPAQRLEGGFAPLIYAIV